MAEESVLRLAEISRLTTTLREKRDELNTEAQQLVKERDRLNGQVAEWLSKAREHREKRDDYNNKVAEFKVKRDEIYSKLKDKIDERQDTEEEAQEIKNKTSAPAHVLRRKIRELDWSLQTQVLDLKHEREIIEQIAQLEEELKVAEDAAAKRKESAQTRTEIEDLRLLMNAHHNSVLEFARLSQEENQLMIEAYAEVDSLRKQADEAHRRYLETRREADETHRRFIEARQENSRLRKEIGEFRIRRRVEKIQELEERLEEKASTALEKFKRGERLTMEEFSLLMKRGLL
ncbi:MAG: coiled-coil protein [Candidatus Odinarchaeota archaeon]